MQLKDSNRDDVPYPHTYSVPYPSDIHWHTAAGPGPWAYSSRPRRFLASFVGGMHGEYGLDVRKKIATDCRDAGEPRCLFSSISALPQRGHCNLKAFKQHATFCLEPGGDSPYRKSLSDDITMGCIPVTFSPYLDMVDPWHWGHFRNQSRVYINPQDYLSGKLNLFEHLESLVATGQAEEMQRAIGKHGHTFQYALSDYPGDAVETLLKGAVGEAEDRERLEPQLRSPWR